MQLHKGTQDLAALVRGLQTQGVRVIVIPGSPGKGGTLASFANVLHFPAYFGGNLDSFEECLGDWAHELREPVSLIWDGAGPLHTDDPDTFSTLCEILSESEANSPQLSIEVIPR